MANIQDAKGKVTGSVPCPTKSHNIRILLADDSQRVRSVIKTLLVDQNPAWEIFEAESGQEALEQVLTQPDLAMLDLNLPDMPGHEVARRIRELSSDTKIIICSFSDSSHLAALAQHIGADGYFTKDSSPDDLHKTIASVLSQ